MQHIKTGILSGTVATVVAGSMLLMNNALHSVPEIHIARSLAALLGSPEGVMPGVIAILILGVFGGGTLFAALAPRLPVRSYLAKSTAFAGASWLFMMTAFMPLTGSGFFGLGGGVVVPVAMLGLCFAYWLVLGMLYRWLAEPAASREALDR